MTTTIRMYQNKGLLHRPGKDGRVAVYDDSHLARVRLIGELQGRGHSLAGIADLLTSYERGEPLPEVLGLSALRAPTEVRLSLVELGQRLGGESPSPSDFVRAAALGLIHVEGDTAVVRDRRFLDIGTALVDLGVPASVVLDEWEHLAEVMDEVSRRFVSVFEQHVLSRSEASLDEVVDTVDRLAGLARDVTITALERSLRSDVDRFVADR